MSAESDVRVCDDCGAELSIREGIAGLCPRCLLGLAIDAPTLLAEIERPVAPTLDFPEAAFSPGQTLGGRYRVRSLLGRGGMGEVWRAFDLKLRVDVALKALRPQLHREERALAALRQEVRTAREVVSANVCRIFDLVELDGREVVSMEYIDGRTLGEVLRDGSPLDLHEAREIGLQFLAGLEAIHAAGLVHRDVKPENLMITRAGRVVVMDFGIARELVGESAGTISGTPAYMAPEQASGQAIDARADVFAAGMVLAEMIAPEGCRTAEAREHLWRDLRADPPRLADTPWRSVLELAVASARERRHASASALARALEEVTLRAVGDDEAHPYPGLARFEETDAGYFFGRELEVEAMWKKLRRPHLLALIGPSGAGKSSFLRAGLLAALPSGWRAVIASPGDRPFTALADALADELAGDGDAVRQLLRFDEPEEAVSLVGRWRSRHDDVLIVLDQFEELFTHCPPAVQKSFAELLSRLALEADARILLSLRDDFLFHCAPLESLGPAFSELTPLKPLGGSALRRALVQPALKCGYRFEDEELVDVMLGEVGQERGALPLLAFAAAQLWDRRDRERGLLTREAYEQIGGVGGALAQHAEATLERIGSERLPLVREVFRNLVTAHGTRSTRDRDELLSVFGETADGVERRAAAAVIDALIDARLLTSFEIEADEAGEAARQRIEIVHESLLSNWPRLVHWRTQDEEGAQLRDQLRQAARMWEERDRPEDLLWTGTSFHEYQLWRERYSGGLSAAEEAFAAAMVTRAERRTRRRRLAVGGAFALLLGVLAVIAFYWRESELARRRADAEARRAEASKLVALARLEGEADHTAAIAYVTSSLELADTREARRLALQILWNGPVARLLPGGTLKLAFSPDGEWLAVQSPRATLVSSDGLVLHPELPEQGALLGLGWLTFSQPSDLLMRYGETQDAAGRWTSAFERWSMAEERELPRIEWDGRLYAEPVDWLPAGLVIWDPPQWLGDAETDLRVARLWSSDRLPSEAPGAGEELGRWRLRRGVFDPALRHLAFVREREVFVQPLDASDGVTPRKLGEHNAAVLGLVFAGDGGRFSTVDLSHEIRVWSVEDSEQPLIATLRGGKSPDPLSWPTLTPEGSRLAMTSSAEESVYLWDVDLPLEGLPLVLSKQRGGGSYMAAFHPAGQWLATAHGTNVALWPIGMPYARSIGPWEGVLWLANLAFSPDSRWLAACGNANRTGAGVRLWPLAPALGEARTLRRGDASPCLGVAFDGDGSHLVSGGFRGQLAVHRLPEGEVQFRNEQREGAGWIYAVALDEAGRRLAAAPRQGVESPENKVLRVWDLESGAVRRFDLVDATPGIERELRSELIGSVNTLTFGANGDLYSGGPEGIRKWDLDSGESEWIHHAAGAGVSYLSPDGRYLLTADGDVQESGYTLSDVEYEWVDLGSGESRRIAALSVDVGLGRPIALDPSGQIYVVGGLDGGIRVGLVEGGEPHLLLGHHGGIHQVAVSPDGRWIASAGSGEIRLWPMPDLSRAPFHARPRGELLAMLRELTNLRAVEDPESESGWTLKLDPFPGWKEVPSW